MTQYSHSRIDTFRKCPFRFKCQYLEKKEPDFTDTIETFMGSRVHEALEKLYKDKQYEKHHDEEAIVAYYHEIWDANWHDAVHVVKDYSPDDYRRLGERFIRDYMKRHAPFNHDRTIAVEPRIIVDLGEGYELQGYIDRLADEGDGVYAVHDYKTSNSLKTQQEAEEDLQLALYALGVKQAYQDCKRVKLVWHMLAHDKDVVIEPTDDDLEATRQKAVALIKEIEAAKDFPAYQSPLCPWCSFRSACPFFKHLAKIERMLDSEHTADDGVKLAQRYIDLQEQKEKIEREMADVKAAIIEYGQNEGVSCVTDGTASIRIWSKECARLPDKRDPRFLQLKDELKSMGRLEEVSTIDTWRLSKIIENKEWNTEELARLKPYLSWEIIERLYPKKR